MSAPMRRNFVLCLLVFFAILTVPGLSKSYNLLQKFEDRFQDFIRRFNKPYRSGTKEYNKRLAIFQDSIKRHQILNAKRTSNESAWYGVTKFSDLTDDEFAAKYLNTKPPLKYTHHVTKNNHRPMASNGQDWNWQFIKLKDIPKTFDWRTKEVVTPIKNQKQCGGCWAFSTVETVESMYLMKTGLTTVDLSVQQVIDCSYGNSGCNGGDTCHALFWMKNAKAKLVTADQYPLTDTSDSCLMLPNGTKGVQVLNYTCQNFQNNEDLMVSLLASKGPLAVSVDSASWKDYLGGIIQYHCYGYNNHAVQIVGYDMTGPIPYYIIRNSWGTDFGHGGYLYVKIGNDVCGVAQEVSTVTV